jgi:hypothetical protein
LIYQSGESSKKCNWVVDRSAWIFLRFWQDRARSEV